jgi:hypothetical protein
VVLSYHDAIESAKADYASGAFPAASKDILNKFIDAYNVLQGAYVTYHTSAGPNPDQTAISAAIAGAAAAFADLVKAYPKAATPSTKAKVVVSQNVKVTVGGVK